MPSLTSSLNAPDESVIVVNARPTASTSVPPWNVRESSVTWPVMIAASTPSSGVSVRVPSSSSCPGASVTAIATGTKPCGAASTA